MKIEKLTHSNLAKGLYVFGNCEGYWVEVTEEDAKKDLDEAYKFYRKFNEEEEVAFLKWENAKECMSKGGIVKRHSAFNGFMNWYREKNSLPKCYCGKSIMNTKDNIKVSTIDKKTLLCDDCYELEVLNKEMGVRE